MTFEKIGIAIVWIIIVAVVVTLLGSQHWISYYRIAYNGVVAKATVVQLQPENHNLVAYKYEISGHNFQGLFGSSPPNPPFSQLKIGQEVVIYYDPQHPENSLLGYPKPIFKDETLGVVIGGVIFPTLILLLMQYGRRDLFQFRRSDKTKRNPTN